VRAVSGELCLPVRKDLEPDEKVAEEKTKELLGRLEELREAEAPLVEVKRLADQINFYAYQSHVFNVYYYLDEEEFKRGEVRLTLPALCLNDVALVGLPGETFFATGRSVKECLERDGRRVITVSEINGDVGYLPTLSTSGASWPYERLRADCWIERRKDEHRPSAVSVRGGRRGGRPDDGRDNRRTGEHVP